MALSADMLEVFSCFFFVSAASKDFSLDQLQITVKPGDDVPLQCRGPTNVSVRLLEWIRPDLDSGSYVFFYRNKRLFENYQFPDFRGRVELRDPGMKDGDFSVVLRNVSVRDEGTYECRVIAIRHEQETPSEIKRLIKLKVTDPAGNTWREGLKGDNLSAVMLVISGLFLLLLLISCVMCKKHSRPESRPDPSPSPSTFVTTFT